MKPHWALLLGFVAACGGRVDTQWGAGPMPDVAGDAGADADPWTDFPICPPDLPASGSACPTPGLGCKYGGWPEPEPCAARACTANFIWRDAPEGCR